MLLLVGGTESPVSRACRIHTDQVHRAGGARAAESTLNQQEHPGRPPRGVRVVGRLSAPRVPHHYRFAREHCPACTFGTPLGARQAVVFACHELSVRERCIKIVGSTSYSGEKVPIDLLQEEAPTSTSAVATAAPSRAVDYLVLALAKGPLERDTLIEAAQELGSTNKHLGVYLGQQKREADGFITQYLGRYELTRKGREQLKALGGPVVVVQEG